jgi:gluconolactonase
MPIIRHSPGLDLIAAEHARVEQLYDGLDAGEGPVWDQERGCLLFTDLQNSLLYRWSPSDGVTVVAEATNHGNGAALDRDGRTLLCQRDGLVAIAGDGKRSVVADAVDGQKFTVTIDVAVRSDGTVYFGGSTSATFVDAGLAIQPDGSVRFVQPKTDAAGNPRSGFCVYRTHLDGDAVVTVALDDVVMPNGLAFSRDESVLYVADTRAARLRAIPVRPDGVLDRASGRTVFDFSAVNATGLTDGVCVDSAGNLYCAAPGGIWIIDPGGQHLGTICLGADEYHTNCAFGGPDLRTLFITTHRLLARVELKIPGFPLPVPARRPDGQH